MNELEVACLKKCAEQQVFFDNSVFEIDSAMELAKKQGKEKRAFIYS